MKTTRKRTITLFAIFIIASLSAGFFFVQESRDFRIAKNLDIFFSLFRELNAFYVDDIDPDKVIKSAIDNMLETLDPYTVYYPESEADEFAFITTGQYGGIGSLIRGGGEYVVISEVYKGFPADIAGIRAGDIIKKVDGVSLKGFHSDKVSDKLKGSPGTDIKLTVERNGKEIDFAMKREKIAIPPVPYYGMISDETGYIRFTNFTQDCVREVKNAFTDLKENGHAEKIILDLRSNPGGLLKEAVGIVNLFVGPGNEVVSTKGKVKQFDEVSRTTKAAVDEDIPLAVLINSSSASASEIVAGAIQDLDRGVIIGQRSYGKGLVQITRPLSYNTQLKVTTAKYYIPSGRCVQAMDFSHPNPDGSVGIIPDSLISEFKTRNGRTVKDGGGITPDIEIVPDPLSQVATQLYLRNFIFDFATLYYWNHPEIDTISDFSFTGEDYTEFRNYLVESKFSYNTVTETAVDQLIASAKREKYYDLHKDLFSRLENEIVNDMDHDLTLFRDEITELIEEELVSRYFYEEGAIYWSINKDEQIRKALEVVNNNELYTGILNGERDPLLVTSNKIKH